MNLLELIKQALLSGYLTRMQRDEIISSVAFDTVLSTEEQIYLNLLLEALLTGEVVMLEKPELDDKAAENCNGGKREVFTLKNWIEGSQIDYSVDSKKQTIRLSTEGWKVALQPFPKIG